uniref:Uncharacterized protein n=1 Tax=Oryza brachyantha TaxID=4533 RepID=J3M8L3_ORYBR
MPPRRAIEVFRQAADGAAAPPPRWRMSLLENTFSAFLQQSGGGAGAEAAAARAVFGEGSLFSPFLFGKFFDPADAFPLWEFEPEVLLAALRRGARTTVDWAETDSEYYLRADIPGGRKCDVEVSGDDAMRVVDISGLWRAPAPDGRDWRAGRWGIGIGESMAAFLSGLQPNVRRNQREKDRDTTKQGNKHAPIVFQSRSEMPEACGFYPSRIGVPARFVLGETAPGIENGVQRMTGSGYVYWEFFSQYLN